MDAASEPEPWRQNLTPEVLSVIDAALADRYDRFDASRVNTTIRSLVSLVQHAWPEKPGMPEREFAATRWLALKTYRDAGKADEFLDVLKAAAQKCSDDQWKQLMRWLTEHQSLRNYGGES